MKTREQISLDLLDARADEDKNKIEILTGASLILKSAPSLSYLNDERERLKKIIDKNLSLYIPPANDKLDLKFLRKHKYDFLKSREHFKFEKYYKIVNYLIS